MNGYLKQSTASQVRTIGPFVDDTDFKTLENALTINNTDIVISINGAADTVKNSGGATAHGAGGIYTLTWDATDTASIGELSYSVKVAGALVVFGTYVVLDEAVYDALFGTVALATATNITAATGVVLSGVTHTGAVIPTVSTLTGHTAQTGDAFARLGAPAGASIAADVATAVSRLPSTLVSGRMDSHVGSVVDGVLTAAKFAAGAFDAVWSVAARVLTAGTNIVLAKGVGVTGLNDLDAAGVRTAVGLATGNMDTQFATILAQNGVEDTGTAQAVTSTSMTLRAAYSSAGDSSLIGSSIVLPALGITGAITAWNNTTKVATVTWSITPTGTPTYVVFGTASSPDIALMAADLTTLINRLTSARAGYLDNLAGGDVALDADIQTLLTRLTALRAGYLDNLSGGAVSLNTDTQTLLTRLTATRAGYIDNISVAPPTAATIATAVDAKLEIALPDSLPAVGAMPSTKQALYMSTQFIVAQSKSGTTVTIKKPDGTTLFTLTLDDAVNPTSITRAT